MIVIDEPYFLAVCVPIKIDRNGMRWCTELWAKDLALHLEYLPDLTLACPRVFAEPTSTDRPLNMPPFNRIKFIDLPSSKGYQAALWNLPQLISKMWAGVKSSRIVHAGFGGWPVSEGWLAIPMGRLQNKFVISYVESSFWRATGKNARWHQTCRSFLLERLNRFCVKIADLRFFTSKAYEEDFLGRGDHSADHAYVTPATWIDEGTILSNDQATSNWNSRTGDIQLVFAGRLLADKGVRVLLEAIALVKSEISANITIIGEGPLAEECAEISRRSSGFSVKVELLRPVQYSSVFFDMLRGFDAVIVPSISDEQPRLIFDAFSQAVPVLGSDTGGIAEVVDNGVNGKLFASGDAASLAETLRWASRNRSTLRSMGMSALGKSRQFTHRAMHARRSKIILAERKLQDGHPSCASKARP